MSTKEQLRAVFPVCTFVYYSYEGPVLNAEPPRHQASVCTTSNDAAEHECLITVYGTTEEEAKARARAVAAALTAVAS